MKLVLFRHAQKGLTPYEDPELTAEGFQQAEVISALVQKKTLPSPTHVWVSPRIRTSQTLAAVCDHFGISSHRSPGLDVQSPNENTAEFRDRISKFLNHLAENLKHPSNETHFLCTHYDWIEEAMTLIDSDKDLNSFEFSHWAPAQYMIFEIINSTKSWKFLGKGAAVASPAR